MHFICIFIYASVALPFCYWFNYVMGFYNDEKSFTEIATVVFYVFVMFANIRKSKNNMPLHYIVFSSLVIFAFIQRELNLIRHICTFILDIDFYRHNSKLLHSIYILPTILLFFKNFRFYFQKLDAKFYSLCTVFVFIVAISQVPDIIHSTLPIMLALEEGLEMTIPLCIYYLLKHFRNLHKIS